MTEAYYKIDFSDPQVKQSVMVTPGTEVKDKLDITLYGRGRKDYGERILENMVHLLENFCSNNIEPQYPTKGQLWYNSGKKELSVYVGEGSITWNPITTAKGFDSTGGTGGVPVDTGNAPVTLNSLRTILQDYLHLSAMIINADGTISSDPSKVYGNIVLDESKVTGWFNADGTIIDTTSDTKMNVAPRDYVDKKVTQQITKLLASVDLSATQTAISSVIHDMDLPLIYRDDALDSKRTMTKPLILMAQSVSAGIGPNDAVSKTYLEQYVNKTIIPSAPTPSPTPTPTPGPTPAPTPGSSGTTLTTSDVENIINSMQNAPWVKKAGDTLTGQLIVPHQVGNNSLTDDTLVTKGYVASLFRADNVPVISGPGTTQMTGSILPDGTMFIRGNIQGGGASGWHMDPTKGGYALATCDVTFDSSLMPADTNYSVFVSEVIPDKNARGVALGADTTLGTAVYRRWTDANQNFKVRDGQSGVYIYIDALVSHSKKLTSFSVSVAVRTNPPESFGSARDAGVVLNDISLDFMVMGKHKGS